MRIQVLNTTDTTLLKKIAFMEEEIFSDSWSVSSLVSTLEQTHGNIWALVDVKQVLAYLIFYIMGDEIEIAKVAVASNARSKGYGKKLLNQLEIFADAMDCKQILLEVRESNLSAISLYEKQGYISLGIRKEYYTAPLEDGVIMVKELAI